MMTNEDVLMWLKTLSVKADNYYCGVMNKKKDRSFGVYQLSRRKNEMAIGGRDPTRTHTHGVSVLVHWNNSTRQTQRAAIDLYDAIASAVHPEIGTCRAKLQDGRCTIHLMHHFTLSSYDAVDFHVRLFAEGCTIRIPAQGIHAVLEGTYLAGQEAWDGLINAYDTVGVEIGAAAIAVNTFTESANAKTAAAMRNNLSDAIGIEIKSTEMPVTGFGESVQAEQEET